MEKRTMERKAADNKYLHRDFHKSMDLGLVYVGEHYGEDGVKEYLKEFVHEYHAPLIQRIQAQGLSSLRDYIQSIYEIEEMPEVLSMTMTDEQLDVKVAKCPAITYFHKIGYVASPWYIEATRTVNQTIADVADLTYTQHRYDETDGHSEYTFARRSEL